jgi:hypothetical protein
VRLDGPLFGQGAAGKWTDAATGEDGDLLDLIRLRCAFSALGPAMDEARSFLALPRPTIEPGCQPSYGRRSTREAARRLFRAGRSPPRPRRPISGRAASPRSIPRCCVSTPPSTIAPHDQAPLRRLPAMLAAITDLEGRIVGINRTWLDVERLAVADLDAPRKVLGVLLGHGIGFGRATDRLLAGESIETVLALKPVLPELPMVSALTATLRRCLGERVAGAAQRICQLWIVV